MANIRVGAAIGAGFGIIARKPLAVLAWGFLPATLQLAAVALIGPAYVSLFSHMAAAGGAPDQTAILNMQAQMAPVMALVQILNLVQLFVTAMVYCAVFRAVLHPERSAWGYLRVGMAELFIVLLTFAAVVVLFIGLLLVMIPVGFVIAIVAAASHGSAAAMGVMIPLIMLLIMVAMTFLALRFSFAGPMMVEDGQFHLLESWTLTRGRVGSLLLIMLGLIGVFILCEIVVVAVLFGVGAAAVASIGGPQALGSLFTQSPTALLERLWPFLVGYIVLLVPLAGCAVAIAGAPFASAYRDVAHDPNEASAAFA